MAQRKWSKYLTAEQFAAVDLQARRGTRGVRRHQQRVSDRHGITTVGINAAISGASAAPGIPTKNRETTNDA